MAEIVDTLRRLGSNFKRIYIEGFALKDPLPGLLV